MAGRLVGFSPSRGARRVGTLALVAALLASVASTSACGGKIAPDGSGDAPDAATVPPGAAALDAAPAEPPALDAGVHADAPPPCVAPTMPPAVAGPGQCVMPSGRLCAGSCTCDDGCNQCTCNGGGWSNTDLACPTPPAVPTGCPASALTPSCRAVPDFDPDCTGSTAARAYYCDATVLGTCGANACPELGCTLASRDGVGGAYWCCP
jgi:hypothetical protein